MAQVIKQSDKNPMKTKFTNAERLKHEKKKAKTAERKENQNEKKKKPSVGRICVLCALRSRSFVFVFCA